MPKQCEKSTLQSLKTILEIRRQITCETTPGDFAGHANAFTYVILVTAIVFLAGTAAG